MPISLELDNAAAYAKYLSFPSFSISDEKVATAKERQTDDKAKKVKRI
ncbi:MAG: hypothetical protein WCP16_21680 [Pseudanabaena sp. ELA645]|jgi:hypothetical protein